MNTLDTIPCPICNGKSFKVVTYRFKKDRIVRCLDCGHIYINPALAIEILNGIYEKYYELIDEEGFIQSVNSWFKDPNGPYQYALNAIEKGAGFLGKRVLDIGCGYGRFLYECRKRGAQITGVDFSLRAILSAKKYFGLNLSYGKFEELVRTPEFSNAEFDFIFAFEIMEHVQKPTELLRAIHKLLTPGGLFFLSVPNFHLFYLIGNGVFAIENRREHIHFFESSSLANLLKQCDFEIIDITSVNPTTYGQRQKWRLLSNSMVKKIWKTLRRFDFVRSLKNTIIDKLDKHMESGNNRLWNGYTLICIARKPNA